MKLPLLETAEERDGLRRACRFNAQLMDFLRPHVKPGAITEDIDRLAHDYTHDHGHRPATLGYKGYPKSSCISINEVVCHGIPDQRVLEEGDIVNVDITTIVEGWYGDQSETFLIGQVSDTARKLVQVTFECLHLAIEALKPGGYASDLGVAIVRHAEGHGFSVVEEYQGHGIGRQFHQEPSIHHYPSRLMRRTVLPPGVSFTVEPMINEGTRRTELDREDQWTVRTRDRKLSAQFEHTVLMTEEGPEILTQTDQGPRRGHQF